ncbi:MAG: pantetheine-phosphate adenylyltransferase [Bacteroidales bacterium]|jgi:pantetheine-phosphate adenylyltransferase|nr:pantetheine-phosphate adenylyltransferase [Bacteroidales bacterium]MDD4236048.1 pantetheine-phosphate adenylyltransferase [Bacteroidales bacterium]MDY0159936.1 pantetheine-phosphate adenylyltransferase [Bacteroidales bacterium]
MERIALFPGSFDPFTAGHESIVRRALPLFDKIIIGIGINDDKKDYFPLNHRKKWIEELFKDDEKVEIKTYSGLTVDYCDEVRAKFILRGLRTSADFEFERAIAQTNKMMDKKIETVFLLTLPEHSFITSSTVREVYKNGGDISNLIPKGISLDL